MSLHDAKLAEHCTHENASVHEAPETGEFWACDDCDRFLGVVDS